MMIDKTTEGYTATTDEIEGMLRNLCAYALSDPDPLQRYIDLTHQQVLFDGIIAAIRRERGKALADLAGLGTPLAKVAEITRLETAQRVKSLILAAGVPVPSPKPKLKSRPAVPPQRALPAGTPRTVPATDREAVPARSGATASPEAPAAPPARAETSPRAGNHVHPETSDRAAMPARVATKPGAKDPRSMPTLPETVTVPPGAKRTLTPAERAALGLPPAGVIPQKATRRSGNRYSTAV